MKKELKQFKSEIIKHFLKWNYSLYTKMNNCTHSFNEVYLTPYHLEGNIWTHTMCVLMSSYIQTNNDVIAALCHDFGKCNTRRERFDEKKQIWKVSFFGHEKESVLPCKLFLIYLRENGIDLTDKDMELILFAVENHLRIYQIKDDKIAEFCNYDQARADCLLTLMKADHDGQIMDYSVENNLKCEICESAFVMGENPNVNRT